MSTKLLFKKYLLLVECALPTDCMGDHAFALMELAVLCAGAPQL